jgi:hypothetical protein
MTEEGLGVPGDIFLHIFPVAFIVANLFAIGTYGKESAQGFNAGAKGKITGYRDQLSEPPGESVHPVLIFMNMVKAKSGSGTDSQEG